MANFIDDSFSGSGNLSGRTPDGAGSTWLNYYLGLPYGDSTSPDNVLDDATISSGAWSYNAATSGWRTISLKSSLPATADYFVETTIYLTTGYADTDVFSGFLGGRLKVGGQYIGLEWSVSDNLDGTFNIETSYNGDGDSLSATGDTARVFSDLPYAAECTIRVEFEGREVRGFLNGVLKFTVTRQTADFDATGAVAWAYKVYADTLDTTKQIRAMTAGYDFLDIDSEFWTDQVLCTETVA